MQDVKSYGRISVTEGFLRKRKDAPHGVTSSMRTGLQLSDSHLDLQDLMRHPIAFLAEIMGNVMYLHQALHQPDSKEFVEAVIKEVNGHIDNDHLKLIPRTEVSEGTEVIPSVWAIQPKRDLTTGKVTKHKARLNLHGWKQEFGTNYYKT